MLFFQMVQSRKAISLHFYLYQDAVFSFLYTES